MSKNSFGEIFKITTFGESHGEALGVIIDGMPSNILVNLDDLQSFVDKRRPGRLNVSTSRDEKDLCEVLSGIFENKTLGTPICIMVKNKNQRSQDYVALKNEPRPGHADQTTIDKYGIRDYRGGGRASGRETVARVIAGYFAQLLIPRIKINAFIKSLGPYEFNHLNPNSKLGLLDSDHDKEVESFLLSLKEKGESCGGKIKVIINNCPAGLGEPVFDKLKAKISHAMLSIGSCMGIHFGYGEKFVSALGSEVSQNTSFFGGIEGGISNGEKIEFELIFKAPSTVGKKAKEGRHDPCILPRVIPVVQSMSAIVLADMYLNQKVYSVSDDLI